MSKIIGIDFGTTNCCMATWEKNEVITIPNLEGARITPSVVAFSSAGEVLIGETAKRQAVLNPKNTIFAVKRLLGRTYKDIKNNLNSFTCELQPDLDGAIDIVINGKNYKPIEIATLIIRKLKNDAEVYLGDSVTQAVITVPAYFNDNERRSIKQAGEAAGLEVLSTINEPTSAALSYGFNKLDNKVIAVYDFGGGTFDLSILKVKNSIFEVIATNGDANLGGLDVDKAVIDFIIQQFDLKNGINLYEDAQAFQRISDIAETSKCVLSSIKSTDITLPFISTKNNLSIHLTETLTRARLDELSKHIIERISVIVDNCFTNSGVKYEDIDILLLVGGMTKMVKIIDHAKSIFQNNVVKSINPDEVVAQGAAIHAAFLVGDVDDIILLDITPISLGIETSGGLMSKIIDKNTTIPTRHSEVFTTESDNQTSVTVNVMQGESDLVKDNKSIGHFILKGIKPAPKGTPHIEVRFDIDANGILNVSAVDLQTGKNKNIEISSILSPTD